jgi:hypothetical protein
MSQEDQPIEKRLMSLLAKELERRLTSQAGAMSAAEMELVRKLTQDAGVTLASVRKGEWGDVAKKAAEQLLEDEDLTDEDLEGLDPFEGFAGPAGRA